MKFTDENGVVHNGTEQPDGTYILGVADFKTLDYDDDTGYTFEVKQITDTYSFVELKTCNPRHNTWVRLSRRQASDLRDHLTTLLEARPC